MKVVRIIVNWFVYLTSPIWIFLVALYHVFKWKESKFGYSLNGKKWFWENWK